MKLKEWKLPFTNVFSIARVGSSSKVIIGGQNTAFVLDVDTAAAPVAFDSAVVSGFDVVGISASAGGKQVLLGGNHGTAMLYDVDKRVVRWRAVFPTAEHQPPR